MMDADNDAVVPTPRGKMERGVKVRRKRTANPEQTTAFFGVEMARNQLVRGR